MGLVVIIIYVIALLSLGYWAMKRTRSVGDFFLGGRTLGPWVSAFAYGTTYFSAVLFIGYGGKLGWGYGIHTMWIVAGNVLVGSLLAWWVLGKRTREMTVRLNAMTLPAFLAERYKSPTLKIAAALLIFVFLVPYSASVYMGLSYLFESALGLSYLQALGLLAALTGMYLVMGGYFAIALTDFLMGTMMIGGVAIMLSILIGKAGGFMEANHLLMNLKECSPALTPGPAGSIPGWVTLASLVVVTSLGPWGLPQMVQKFYSIKSSMQIKRAMIVATLFALVITFGGYYTGALSHINMPDDPKAMSVSAVVAEGEYTPASELPVKIGKDGKPVILSNGKPDIDWDRWIPSFLMHKLPAWMMIFIALLVFSASMSTLSSLVLVSSSAIAMDLCSGGVKQNVERKGVLVLMRVLCGVFVLLSLYMALRPPGYIITLMVVSWGVLAGAFAAPYIYGLFWRRATAAGAGAGMIVGVGIAVAFYIKLGQPGVPLGGALAILTPLLVVPVVSLFTKPMAKADTARAFSTAEEEIKS